VEKKHDELKKRFDDGRANNEFKVYTEKEMADL